MKLGNFTKEEEEYLQKLIKIGILKEGDLEYNTGFKITMNLLAILMRLLSDNSQFFVFGWTDNKEDNDKQYSMMIEGIEGSPDGIFHIPVVQDGHIVYIGVKKEDGKVTGIFYSNGVNKDGKKEHFECGRELVKSLKMEYRDASFYELEYKGPESAQYDNTCGIYTMIVAGIIEENKGGNSKKIKGKFDEEFAGIKDNSIGKKEFYSNYGLEYICEAVKRLPKDFGDYLDIELINLGSSEAEAQAKEEGVKVPDYGYADEEVKEFRKIAEEIASLEFNVYNFELLTEKYLNVIGQLIDFNEKTGELNRIMGTKAHLLYQILTYKIERDEKSMNAQKIYQQPVKLIDPQPSHFSNKAQYPKIPETSSILGLLLHILKTVFLYPLKIICKAKDLIFR